MMCFVMVLNVALYFNCVGRKAVYKLTYCDQSGFLSDKDYGNALEFLPILYLTIYSKHF